MSVTTCIQPKANYNFSIEKPTQSQKNIAIQQTSEGLKIFVKDGLKTVQVERSLIDGLPKMNLVPKEFFDSCHATLKTINGETKLAFFGSLKGGAGLDGLIESLRSNLENDFEIDLSEEEIDQTLNLFRELVEKKQNGSNDQQLQDFMHEVQEKLQSEGNSNVAKAFDYVLERAEGKYASVSISFMGFKIKFAW